MTTVQYSTLMGSPAHEEIQAAYGGMRKSLGKPIRRYVETVLSGLTNLFARKIHADTPMGFEL